MQTIHLYRSLNSPLLRPPPLSSPRLASPLTMSLSSLPTELVRQIIDSTLPSISEKNFHKTRQRTLSPLCLVSRQFRDISQSILREIIWLGNTNVSTWPPIKTVDNWHVLDLAAEAGWGNAVRYVVLSDATTEFSSQTIEHLVSTCPELAQLAISRWTDIEVCLGSLARLSCECSAPPEGWQRKTD